jgi:hypothetical protein
MLNLGRKKRGRPAIGTRARTTVSFSADDLAVLATLIATGQALLPRDAAARPVVSRLKAAMTRLRLPIPHGM